MATLAIDLDRPAALSVASSNRALDAQGPAHEGVRLRGRVDFDGPLGSLHDGIDRSIPSRVTGPRSASWRACRGSPLRFSIK